MYGSGGYHSIGNLNFRSASGRQRLDVNIQSNHLVQGDKFSGTYKVPIFLNDATESGTWALEGVYLRDDSGNYQNIDRDDWDEITPPSTAEASHLAKRLGADSDFIGFDYINNKYKDTSNDLTPPKLKKFSIEPISAQKMLVTLKVTDSQSGVLSKDSPTSSELTGKLEKLNLFPSGRQEIEVNILNGQRIEGDKFSGTYKVPIVLGDYHEPGTWTLSELELRDNAGNEQYVDIESEWETPVLDAEKYHLAKRLGVDPDSLSFNYKNSKYKDISQDVNAPTIQNLSVANNNEDKIIVTLKLADDLSGLKNEDNHLSSGFNIVGEIEFTSPSGLQKIDAYIQ